MPADGTLAVPAPKAARSPNVSGLQRLARRRSTIAFLMALPLLLIIGGLVVYPFFYAIYLSTLNRRMTALHRPRATSPSCSTPTPSSW